MKTFHIQSISGGMVRDSGALTQESHPSILIADLPPGMYLIKLKGGNKVWWGKFIKLK